MRELRPQVCHLPLRINHLGTAVINLNEIEGVYVTIVHPAFCLSLYLNGVHFRGELQRGGDVSQQKISQKNSVDRSEIEK